VSRSSYRRAKAALDGRPLRADEKKAKRSRRREAVSEIRSLVIARAKGKCEACGGAGVALDHWLGGNGRRRVAESVETCWLLCRRCDEPRTANKPSAGYWNDMFAIHCARHGYPVVRHVEHGGTR
jgi:hypothetical protein